MRLKFKLKKVNKTSLYHIRSECFNEGAHRIALLRMTKCSNEEKCTIAGFLKAIKLKKILDSLIEQVKGYFTKFEIFVLKNLLETVLEALTY